MYIVRNVLLITLAAVAAFSQDTVPVSDPFVMPENLRANVAFWKKIYTEVSLSEGLVHDRDHPLVIFRQIKAGQPGGSRRKELLKQHIDEISAMLRNITNIPESEWSSEEKRIKELYDTNAPAGSISGAHDRVRFQQGQKERFIEGLQRSGMYLDTIKAILKEHGVPQRLAYLPHVESSFEVEAYSKVGAAGLWQFMRATGKSFGLTVDYNIDERRDPIKATVAAAKLLAYNYRALESWPLAITAYNHGTAGMRRAVERTGTREIGLIIERHESPSFKFASKNFYGCFLAASEIAMNYTGYFGSVALFDRAEWTTIALTEYVRPSVLIEHLGISEHQLRRLNPALRPALFQHQKQIPAGFELHLPAAIDASDALAKIAAIPESLRSAKAERPQYYNVQKGDNLISIASRLGVSAEELAAVNNISSKNRIYAGQVLHLPGTTVTIAQAPQPKPVTPARTVQPAPVVPTVVPDIPSRLPEPPETLPVAPEPPPPAPAVADTMRAILFASAEPLPSPARVPAGALSQFDAGVYNLDITVSTPGLAAIRISINETLGHYADWLGIPATRIRNANRLRGQSTIRVGQQLTIPLDAPDALERFTRARLEYHLANEEDFYGRFKVEDVRQRTIRRGETLWDITSEEGGTPLWLFKKHNRTLDIERLAPGMVVLMPVSAEKSEEDLALERLEEGSLLPTYVEPLLPRAGFPGLLP